MSSNVSEPSSEVEIERYLEGEPSSPGTPVEHVTETEPTTNPEAAEARYAAKFVVDPNLKPIQEIALVRVPVPSHTTINVVAGSSRSTSYGLQRHQRTQEWRGGSHF